MCKLYGTDKMPEVCKRYPWDFIRGCIYVSGNMILTETDLLKIKTKQEVEEYCLHCGKCCPNVCGALDILPDKST